MSRLSDWWRRLRGRPADPPPERKATPARPPAAPHKDGELELAQDAGPKKPRRTAAAGFDPYASDGGFAKPSKWERIDHD
jgi:hypothetical protein